ncbi:hypothetical protein D9756_006496 [Leucocoprinus leucothites]|uniref:Uncharacterized protein n=1 Tax=Leucocoprinus leucothites TaxID=201217 RepID=A0A8H5LHF7_9AGAR|nr:hypothetical protein D9756_006496 [Leucoagaricus leucothites]
MTFTTLPPPPLIHPEPDTHQHIESPWRTIHSAADELVQLFSRELEDRISRERDLMYQHYSSEREKIYRDIQQEREALGQIKAELERQVQREREQVQRERAMRFESEKLLREENEALRISVLQLQATLDTLQIRKADGLRAFSN